MTARYKPYPEYKPSGVEWLGDVPAGWGLWKLAHAFSGIGSGTTPSSNDSSYYEGTIPWITTGELRERTILDTKKKLTVDALRDFSALKKFPAGSVAIAMYGATIGRLGVFGIEATTNQACCVLPRSRVLDNRYVFYWLQSFREKIIQLSVGGGQPNINQEIVASLKVSAPNKTGQEAIVLFLDRETGKIDRLVEKQERMMVLLKEKRQAVISHAVTKGLDPNTPMKDSGIEWLGDIPEHWEVSALKYYWNVIDCKHLTAEFVDDGVPLASIKEVQRWTVNLSSAKQTTEHFYQLLIEGGRKPRAGDIIYSRNATVGEASLVIEEHPKFSMGQDVCILKPQKGCSSEYYMYLLKSPAVVLQLNELMVGATFKRINVENIRNFIAFHPPKKEQTAIAEHLKQAATKIDNLIAKSAQAIELMKERRTALISAAVTGKIDVREEGEAGLARTGAFDGL